MSFADYVLVIEFEDGLQWMLYTFCIEVNKYHMEILTEKTKQIKNIKGASVM